MPLFKIEALSQYRMVYVVEAPDQTTANQAVISSQVEHEWGQQHLGEVIFHTQETNRDEIIPVFDQLNPYAKSWHMDQKLKLVHVAS